MGRDLGNRLTKLETVIPTHPSFDLAKWRMFAGQQRAGLITTQEYFEAMGYTPEQRQAITLRRASVEVL